MAYVYRNAEPPPVDAPNVCPVCRSDEIMTTSKTVSAATYWRCKKCGEIWNVGRRQAPPRRNWPR